MTIDTAVAGGPAARRSFTVAPKVAVFINGKEQAGDVPLTIADLNPGDRVTITYDAVVHKIEATRDVAVSGQIARLESRMGVRLFRRTTRSVAMTEEGERYAGKVRDILAFAGDEVIHAYDFMALRKQQVSEV